MIEIRTRQWRDVGIHELAELTCAALRASANPRHEGLTVEGMENWLNRLRFETPPVVVQAYQAGDFVGWLLLFLHDAQRGEINPWALDGHPLIAPEKEKEQLESHLLEAVIAYAREIELTRIELSFLRVPGEEEQVYDEYRRRYETHGFQFMTESVLLRRRLQNLNTEKISILSKFELKPLNEIDLDDLYQCYYTTFSTGKDRFFFDQTDDERRAFFDETFDLDAPLNTETSLILVKNDQITGFSLVRPTHGQGNAHLWMLGVHPEYRRKGLATTLLRYIMKKSSKHGFTTMSMVCERSNHPAYSLYQKLGFQKEFTKIEYSWKAKSFG